MEDFVISILGSNAVGKVILLIIGIIIIVLAVLEKTTDIFSGYSERKEKKKEAAMRKALENEKFRENIDKIVTEVPKLSEQITNINSQIESYVSRESTIEETQKMCIEKIEKLQSDLDELRKSSDTKDAEITQHLQTTTDTINTMQENMKDVSEKVGLIIDADVDEFRIYLMQCYNKYVIGNERMPRQEKQILKAKFKRYKSEGGNGWAESLMHELDEVDAEYDIRSAKNTK